MDYKKIYNQIIDNRKQNSLDENEYGEWHHIVPKCLGGSDDNDNLVRLSAREHFICHALLAEMYEYGTNEWYKMNHAFMMMKSEGIGQSRYFNSRLYEAKRKDFSEVMSKSQSGKNNSQYRKIWIYNIDKEKSIRIDNNELNEYEQLGWCVGRIINWDNFNRKTTCLNCNTNFIPDGNERICSDKCKHFYLKEIRKPKDIIDNINEISKRYDIKYNSISKNKEFVLECLDSDCSKNQICNFLKVNGSGANYNTINKIYNNK